MFLPTQKFQSKALQYMVTFYNS